MKHIPRQVSLLAVSVVMALGLAVVPVGAEHGVHAEGTDDSTSTSTGTGTNTGESSDGQQTTTTGTENETETGGGRGLRDEARTLLTEKRKNGKEHSTELRQKACEQRQKSIDKRTSNFAAAAQRHLDVFNKIFTKVQAFHDSKGLNVTGYDTLVATVTTKQTAAQAAVDALKALDVQIDCTQSDPATTVATIKTAVTNAHNALKDYRKALKDLVVALKGASTAEHTDTTGGDQ